MSIANVFKFIFDQPYLYLTIWKFSYLYLAQFILLYPCCSPRGQCLNKFRIFEGKAFSDEKTLPVTWSGWKTHPTILPRSGLLLLLLLLSFAFTISSDVSAASWRPHPVLDVVLRCHRRCKATGTHSRYASWFDVHRSRRVVQRRSYV